jgi:hypothetical protein
MPLSQTLRTDQGDSDGVEPHETVNKFCASQSLRTDQGDSDPGGFSEYQYFVVTYLESQSLRTDQGDSDWVMSKPTGWENGSLSQSLRTDQGDSNCCPCRALILGDLRGRFV